MTDSVLTTKPIAQDRFMDYVKQLHKMDDEGFEEQYKVYTCMYIHYSNSQYLKPTNFIKFSNKISARYHNILTT